MAFSWAVTFGEITLATEADRARPPGGCRGVVRKANLVSASLAEESSAHCAASRDAAARTEMFKSFRR